MLFKSSFQISHRNTDLWVPGLEETSWLPKEKTWNQDLTGILIQERTVTIFAVLWPEQHMAAQLTNIIFSSFFFFPHFTCTFHLWNIKTSHKVPVNPLAPQHPSSGLWYLPGASFPAVRGLRPAEQLMVRECLIFPYFYHEGPTLWISRQTWLCVRKFIAYWLQNKPSVTLHPRAFLSPKSDVFSKSSILTVWWSWDPRFSTLHSHSTPLTPFLNRERL